MLKTVKKKILGAFCIFLVICTILCIYASADTALHWYCKRNAQHKQPLLDPAYSMIEEYQCVYVDKAHNEESTDKVVYLTFDAGYENGNVEKILDILRDENICGAFFILDNLIKRNPELVKRMADEGHLVCNHTSNHKNITKVSKQDLIKEIRTLEQSYTNLTGKQMAPYFRPPEGTFDRNSLSIISDYGYKTVFWSFAYADWDNENQMSPEAAKKKILENLHNGEIMLLHPTSATNAGILHDVIIELKNMGYRFGSLDELSFEQS